MADDVLKPGQVVQGYRVLDTLGKGAQAVVYRVQHTQRRTQHALKVLHTQSDELVARMRREGEIHRRIAHTNVVHVDEVLEVDGAPALVTELVHGITLKDLLEQHVPTHDEARSIFVALLAAIRQAHRQGYVHRDLKPENILLAIEEKGVVPKIMDFGLVKNTDTSESDLQLTRANSIVGTPRYMAPEQIRDPSGVDPRVDLYALGCILYELLVGKPAYAGDRMLSVLSAVFKGRYEPIPQSAPPDLRELCIDLMQPDPDDRPRSALDVIVRLGKPATGAAIPISAEARALFPEPFVLPAEARPKPRKASNALTWAYVMGGLGLLMLGASALLFVLSSLGLFLALG